MRRSRKCVSLLSVPLLFWISNCSNKERPQYSQGPANLSSKRLGVLFGDPRAVASYDQRVQTREFLTNELWVGLDAKDRPLRGVTLEFIPFEDRFTYKLGFPDGLCLQGETYKRRAADGRFRGFVQNPLSYSGSRIFFESRATEAGTVLDVELDPTFGLAWIDTYWTFQRASNIKPVE